MASIRRDGSGDGPVSRVLGGDVGGAIELRLPFNPAHEFHISLECRKVRTASDDRAVSERVVWQTEGLARAEPGLRGTRVNFKFAVPATLPQSEDALDNRHVWTVNLSADLPGINLDRRFEIPVFKIARPLSSKQKAIDTAETGPPPVLPPNVVRVSHSAAGRLFYYPLLRNLGVGLTLLIVGMIFAGATGFMVYGVFQESVFFAPILSVFVIVFGLTTTAILTAALYVLGNTLRVEIGPGGVGVTRKVFGLAFKRYIARDQIRSIDKTIGSQSQTGSKIRVNYQIKLTTKDGKKIILGDSLRGARMAEQVLKLVRDASGLGNVATDPAFSESAKNSEEARSLAKEQVRRIRRIALIASNLVGLAIAAYVLYQFRDLFLDLL